MPENDWRSSTTRPWGPGATLGLSIAVLILFIGVQAAVAYALRDWWAAPVPAPPEGPAGQEWNGLHLSISLLASAPVGIAVMFWLTSRRGGRTDGLGLRPVTVAAVARWLLLVVLFIVATDLVTYALDQEVVPDFMLEAYRTAGILPLFWIAVGIAAPAFEEMLFRGFLFGGIERSRLGGVGAIVLTALGWSLLHAQYELYHLTIVFGAGLLLGLARWRTRSVYPPLAMHVVWNLIATAEVAVGVAS